MFWPLAGSAARLVIVAIAGWVCVRWLHAPAGAFFAVLAVSLAAYGAIIAGTIGFGRWTA